ncbi:alpha/beta hydrolase [Paraburkholderia sp. 5N]|uniref:Alpha/beta hydrolase n=1 Tax=Paraburkholderia elongata TaxID=2675747 RepID=A0A972SPN4_9BURK|nr:alpha/beta hydrolase [Paraburkholderia elongata]
MTQDARVRSAIAHWGPRFVSNGVLLVDFNEVTAGISRWEDWCQAWCDRAAEHEQLGTRALADDYYRTAGEHLNRAAVYYHFAKFVFVNDLEQMRQAHMKAVMCRTMALAHIDPPGERIEFPFLDGNLVGVLRKPNGIENPPLVIIVPGLDSAKEELEAYELPFLARGMATFIMEGPGQGESEYRYPIRGDYEVAVTAAVDWALTRNDLNTNAIGLVGVSLGGYYAPRAVAYEKRIRACVSLSGPFDLGELWDDLPELTKEAFRVRSKCNSDEEARARASTLTLKEAAKHIECPLMLVAGKQDRLVPWTDALKISELAPAECELILVDDGNHIVNNRPERYRSQIADWMLERLTA